MTAFDFRHGGALDRMRAAFPDAPEPWLDLSTGVNPDPYPDTAIADVALRHLPTSAQFEACRRAMAAAFSAPADCVLPTPGSETIIRLLPDVLGARSVAILSPTYGDHETAWRGANADLSMRQDPRDVAGAVDVVVLCNPNNPDGRSWSPAELEPARRVQAARGGWLIVDEAYADLDPAMSMAPSAGADGLIVLRSFGKFFGLAGLRLGATLAPLTVLDGLARRLGVWAVSGPALMIGARAYADHAWAAATRKTLVKRAEALDVSLQRAGLSIAGGTALFRFVAAANAHDAWTRLAKAGIYVRRFLWSEDRLRIGLPPKQPQATRIVSALKDV